MDFPAWLKDKRRELSLTQRGMAKYAGLSSSQISNYENGKAFPDPPSVEVLADYLKVEPSEIERFRPRRPPLGRKEQPEQAVDNPDINLNISIDSYPALLALLGTASRIVADLRSRGVSYDDMPGVLPSYEEISKELGRLPLRFRDVQPEAGSSSVDSLRRVSDVGNPSAPHRERPR